MKASFRGAGEPVKVLDLFSGIGGFSIGLERAGMETVAFCEIDLLRQDKLSSYRSNLKQMNADYGAILSRIEAEES